MALAYECALAIPTGNVVGTPTAWNSTAWAAQGLNGAKSTPFLILSLARQSATSDKQEGYQ